jgi:hypothetical protein
MNRSPFRGLVPFTEADAPLFFGREREARIVAANLRSEPLTVVYGAGGVGKTSLLRAGVAARIRDANERAATELVVVCSAWGDDPLREVVRALQTEALRLGDIDRRTGPQRLDDLLEELAERLNRRILVILDQFEEYFLYHPTIEFEGGFDAELARAVSNADPRARFLIAVREDAFAALDRFAGDVPRLFDNCLRIEHLNRAQAREACLSPIGYLNTVSDDEYAIESELVDAVLDQIQAPTLSGRPTAGQTSVDTALLQLVMRRLWLEEVSEGSRTLRFATLERLGGARTIVGRHVDDAMASLSVDEQELAALAFDALVTPSGIKIAHSVDDLATYAGVDVDQLARVLEKLSGDDVRIIRALPPPSEYPGAMRYEIFHSVLIAPIRDWRTRWALEVEARRGRRGRRASLLRGRRW